MDKQELYALFQKYENVRGNLFCRLINTGRNREYLMDMPARRWMDLSVCCYYDMGAADSCSSFVSIRKPHLALWGIEEERLLEEAWENTVRKKTPLFERLDRVLQEMDPETVLFPEEEPDDPRLYILSDEERAMGSVFITVPRILRVVGDVLGEDYYIIPSSIHECLILPDAGQTDEEGLNRLVRHVNRVHVEEREILADHVYRYERETERIRMCTA